MSEMIERVADALLGSDDIIALTVDEANGLARIAIAAMREPTEEMLGNYENASFIWPLMIDVALKDFGK